jgi:antitoxin (DNA-binding transcriptional repressor) of toxin-antitoxin stability system
VIIQKNNIPLVELVPHVVAGPRRLGALSGQFQVPDDFSDENEEVNSLFYGDKS